MIGFLSPQDLHYRQTIAAASVGEYKLVRRAESGDEYAHVRLALEPLENGGGFEFSDQIAVDAAVPEKFLSHIEIGALQAARVGLWGFALADFHIRVLDGSDVDSTDAAFEEAAKIALLEAMEHSAPRLLEPWITLKVRCPEEYLAAVFADLNSRRGIVESTESGKRPAIGYSLREELFTRKCLICGTPFQPPDFDLGTLVANR